MTLKGGALGTQDVRSGRTRSGPKTFLITADVCDETNPPCTVVYVAVTAYYTVFTEQDTTGTLLYLAAGVPHYIPATTVQTSVGGSLNAAPATPDVMLGY